MHKSEVTPRSPARLPLSRPPSLPQPPSHGTSPAMMPMLSEACTSISSVTTPTAAHPPALTVGFTYTIQRYDISLIRLSSVNPFSKDHGAPDAAERHVGDLGNFVTDAQGNAKGSITDKLVKLIGPESVIGVC